MNQRTDNLAQVIVTLECNFACAHCIFSCDSSKKRYTMTKNEIIKVVRYIGEHNGFWVGFSGGEASLYFEDLVFPGMEVAYSYGLATHINTNGWWGKHQQADKWLDFMVSHGLRAIKISYDRYHAEFIDYSVIHSLVEKCHKRCVYVEIEWSGLASSAMVDILGDDVSCISNVRRYKLGYDMDYLGRAALLPENHFYYYHWRELSSIDYCDTLAKKRLAFFPGGWVALCCGTVPRLFYRWWPEIDHLERLWQDDPAYVALKNMGPGGIMEQARSINPNLVKNKYTCMCQPCCDLLPALFPRKGNAPDYIYNDYTQNRK